MAVELFDFRDHLAEPIGDDTAGSFQAMTSIPVAHVPGQSLWQAAEPFNAELSDGIRRRHHLAALSTVPLLIPKTPANADTVVKLLDSRGPGNLCLTYLDVADFPMHIGEWTLSGVQFVSGTSITGYTMLTAVSGHAAQPGLDRRNLAGPCRDVDRERGRRAAQGRSGGDPDPAGMLTMSGQARTSDSGTSMQRRPGGTH
jgi:hypothetical protein